MIAKAEQIEPQTRQRTVFSFEIEAGTKAIKDLIVYGLLSLAVLLPLLGFAAGCAVNVFRWITGI